MEEVEWGMEKCGVLHFGGNNLVGSAIRSILREAASRGPSALADILVTLNSIARRRRS